MPSLGEANRKEGKRLMVKALVFAAGAALAASTLTAQAMPMGPTDLGQDSLVTTIAQGCGPGYFRNEWGHCRPMRRERGYGGPAMVVRPPVVVAPRVVAPRRCVTRMTPYGVREVCR
jgi:hypothetical protein